MVPDATPFSKLSLLESDVCLSSLCIVANTPTLKDKYPTLQFIKYFRSRMISLRPTPDRIFSSYWGILGHVTCLEQSCASEHRGILCVDARDEWNILSSAPFVIFERAAAGFKRVIYVVSNILSRDWMNDYNKFTHISNPMDIHNVCRDFG